MRPITERELVLFLCDGFHDWIDGDDPVETYNTQSGNKVYVKFESGAEFTVEVIKVLNE